MNDVVDTTMSDRITKLTHLEASLNSGSLHVRKILSFVLSASVLSWSSPPPLEPLCMLSCRRMSGVSLGPGPAAGGLRNHPPRSTQNASARVLACLFTTSLGGALTSNEN